AGPLRLELAQFRELAAFAAFGSDLDAATKRQLDRGVRLQEILKQGQYAPMDVSKQTIVIYAVTQGYLDKVPANKVKEFEEQLLSYIDSRGQDVLAALVKTQAVDSETQPLINKMLETFTKQFSAQA
ncbi:MAG: F0F1 ATP synthase subunit alpha, partial [Proteobacteria bacterium]|nr:F0F1 ATP synthase subunit alpha [Pseudomonadota bacterium]